MAKQKDHKLTYKFISALQNLLKNDDWTQHHQVKIVELRDSLDKSPQELADARVAGIRAKGKKFDEKNYPKMIASFERAQDATRAEIAKLEQNLAQGVYTIGIEPFDSVEDARQMLSFAHILEVDTGSYNQDAVNALRNMLQANFSDLCTGAVVSRVFTAFNEEPTLQGDILKKIIEAGEIRSHDLDCNGLNLEFNDQLMEVLIENHRMIDQGEFQKIVHELNFVSSFYQVGAFRTGLYSIVASQAFNSAEDFEHFLEKFVDFSTVHTLERDLAVHSMPRISSFSGAELSIWRDLINTYGTKALKAFSQAETLKDMGVEISALSADLGMEDAFDLISAKLREIVFEREAEHEELAALCRKYNLSEEVFNMTLDDVLPRQKISDILPDIKFEFKSGKHTYSFEKLAAGDIDGLFLGKLTNCCQFIGGAGEECAVNGFTREDVGFYVIREDGKIKAQSYAWFGVLNDARDVVVFDSFEFMQEVKDIFLPVMKQFQSILNQQTGMTLVVGTGSSTPPIDAVKFSDLKTKSEDLERYERDSDEVYEITQSSKVLAPQQSNVTDYVGLTTINPRITFGKILEKHSDQYYETLSKYNFSNISNVASLLLEEGGDIESIIGFVSRGGNQELIDSFYNNRFSAYQACKQKIAECKAQGITDPKEIVDYIFPVQSFGVAVEYVENSFEDIFGAATTDELPAGAATEDDGLLDLLLAGDLALAHTEDYSA